LGEDAADTLFSFVYVVAANGLDYELFELGKFATAIRRDLLRHLPVVVFELADLFQLANVQVDLLLVLLLEVLPTHTRHST